MSEQMSEDWILKFFFILLRVLQFLAQASFEHITYHGFVDPDLPAFVMPRRKLNNRALTGEECTSMALKEK